METGDFKYSIYCICYRFHLKSSIIKKEFQIVKKWKEMPIEMKHKKLCVYFRQVRDQSQYMKAFPSMKMSLNSWDLKNATKFL